ncbi:MAG: diguanylate cyclase, partial [Pseudomonadales bacterium]|nr:diguanylate cyclase [Pseudomonadales bacterium]
KLQLLLATLKKNPSQAVSLSLGLEGKIWSVGISYLPELDWYNFSLINAGSLVNNQSLETSFSIFLISTFTLIVLGLILVDKTVLSKVRVLHRKVDESYQHDDQRPLVLEGDELVQLEAAFETMTHTLHVNMVDLESKVSKRTRLLKEKNAQLIELALTDPLTGLLNRRGLVERFGVEIERSRRENSLIGVVMVDIDDFKKVNDQHGHDVGDAVIRSCSAIIAETCRTTDVAARWGGEEFLVIIPDVNIDALKSILMRMLREIREFRLSSEQGNVSYTVSMGAVIMNPAETDMNEMIGAADSALYSVKKKGKNNFYISGC